MRLIELFEARKNPNLNARDEGHQAARQFLSAVPYNDRQQYGVSMTELPKLGINPQSAYNTPIGIYSYPAENYIKVKGNNAKLPFQDDATYIQIFKVNGNILNISDMTSNEHEHYIDILISKSHELAEMYNKTESDVKKEIEHIIDPNTSDAARVHSNGGYFWYETMMLAKWLGKDKKSRSGKEDRASPIVWNKLFRIMGIDAVHDDGSDIIHSSEPYQLVVFNPSKIEHIKIFTNIDDNSRHRRLDALRKKQKLKMAELNKLSPLGYLMGIKDWVDYNAVSFPTDPNLLRIIVRKLLKDVQDPDSGIQMLSYTNYYFLINLALRVGDQIAVDVFREQEALTRWKIMKSMVSDMNIQLDDGIRNNDPSVVKNRMTNGIDEVKYLLRLINSVPKNDTLNNISSQLDDVMKKYDILFTLAYSNYL